MFVVGCLLDQRSGTVESGRIHRNTLYCSELCNLCKEQKEEKVMRLFSKRSARGFTLVEIMIVVAIIALLAAIAIPNLLRARHNANETAAIGAMRTLSSALESFRAAQAPPTYPAALDELSDADPQYVPASLTGADGRQGYAFTYVQATANEYTLNGDRKSVV